MTRIRIRLNVIQEKFWMDDLLKSPSTEYNDPNHTFIIKGNLSLPVLKEAYRKIMVAFANTQGRKLIIGTNKINRK